MTVVNPKSISGINSITTGSGSDNLLTIHTSDASSTERVRINSSGDVIVGSGITVSPDGDIFTTGVTTATTFVGALTGNVTGNATGLSGTPNISAGTIAGSTGTFTGDVDIADKIIHTGDTNTAIRFPEADTITFEASGNEQVRINNDVQMFVQANSKQSKLQLHREDVSINADDVVGQITFTGRDSGGAGIQRVGAAISAIASNAWDTGQTTGYSATHLDFYTQAQQSAYSTLTPRVRIDSSGRVLIGTTDAGGGNADDLTVATSGNTGITIRSGTSNTGNIFWSDATSGSDQYVGALEYHHSDNQFKFNISNTTRMTVDSTGDVTISDGDLVIGTDGHGIDFSADGNTGGMTSELLDDYEEGTFTPTSNATLTESGGSYTKIGRQVTVHIRVVFASQSSSTNMQVQNLPFTAAMQGGVSNGAMAGGFGYISGGSVIPQIHDDGDDNDLRFYNFGVPMTISNISGKEFRFGFVYHTAT